MSNLNDSVSSFVNYSGHCSVVFYLDLMKFHFSFQFIILKYFPKFFEILRLIRIKFKNILEYI